MPLKRLEPCVRQPDRRRRAGLRQLVRERDPVVEALPGPETVTLVVKCPARPQKRQREKIYCGKLRPLKIRPLKRPGGRAFQSARAGKRGQMVWRGQVVWRGQGVSGEGQAVSGKWLVVSGEWRVVSCE